MVFDLLAPTKQSMFLCPERVNVRRTEGRTLGSRRLYSEGVQSVVTGRSVAINQKPSILRAFTGNDFHLKSVVSWQIGISEWQKQLDPFSLSSSSAPACSGRWAQGRRLPIGLRWISISTVSWRAA